MSHHQYRESLLTKLRDWRLAHLEGSIGEARRDLRRSLSEAEINLLFDNWLNANFDRIEVRVLRPGSVVAVVRARARPDPDQKRREAVLANRLVTKVKSNLFEEFAARVWETVLPNGITLREATGKDMKHASGWFGELGKRMKATEKVAKKFSTRQLFNLSQRKTFAGEA